MKLTSLVFVGMLAIGCAVCAQSGKHTGTGLPGKKYAVVKSDAEWRKLLGEKAFQILRRRDTEEAFTGKYWDHHEKGVYECAGCGQDLFSSSSKFDSGTGWPSFYKPLRKEALDSQPDYDMGYKRIEVMCSKCGGHLGHVFEDGPKPTGLRYCINSASLKFKKAKSG